MSFSSLEEVSNHLLETDSKADNATSGRLMVTTPWLTIHLDYLFIEIFYVVRFERMTNLSFYWVTFIAHSRYTFCIYINIASHGIDCSTGLFYLQFSTVSSFLRNYTPLSRVHTILRRLNIFVNRP